MIAIGCNNNCQYSDAIVNLLLAGTGKTSSISWKTVIDMGIYSLYLLDKRYSHYRFEIRQNSVKSTVRSEIDHFRCKIGSG